MRNKASHTIKQLRGKDFEPPRKPDLLTRPLVIAFTDRAHGKQKGKGDAVGHSMADETGALHVDNLIAAQAARAIADQKAAYAHPIENAEKARQDAVEQQNDAAREMEELEEKDLGLQEKEEALGDRRGPTRFGYVMTRVVLFAFVAPIDYAAVAWTPLPPVAVWLLTILLGIVMVLAAEKAAQKTEDLREAHENRDEDAFAYRQEQVILGFALGAPLAVIVGTALWRAQAFAADEAATGGLVHGGVTNIAFAFLAAMAFVVAYIAGLAYRRFKPLREVQAERADNSRQCKAWQQVMNNAQRLEREAEVTIEHLEGRLVHVIEAIGNWAKERRARLRQRAANVEMRERKKLAQKAPPEPAPPEARPTENATPVRLRGLDQDAARLDLLDLGFTEDVLARDNRNHNAAKEA